MPNPTTLVVVAAAGYGKTAALRARLHGATQRWYPGADAVEALRERAAPGTWLVLDDVPRLTRDASAALVAAAAELPAGVGVALASRWPLGVRTLRWRGAGVVRQTHPKDLALTPDGVSALLGDEYGLVDPGLPERVHGITAGWPALVHLVAETLVTEGIPDCDLLAAVTAPETPLSGYLVEEVLGPLPAGLRRLVRDAALLHPIASAHPLGSGLGGVLGHRRPAEAIALLGRTGLLDAGPARQRRLVPVVAAVVQRAARQDTVRKRAGAAAAWFREHGQPVAAARAYALAGDASAGARLLVERGAEMLTAGAAPAIVELVDGLPPGLRSPRLGLLRADALRLRGDLTAAIAAYAELTPVKGPWDPGLAWRYGLAHYLRGEPGVALEHYGRADLDAGDPVDRARLAAATASAHALLGDPVAGAAAAERALDLGTAVDDARSIAAAHTAFAQCLRVAGDAAGREQHSALALRLAERAGDAAQTVRILVNCTHDLLLEARYPEAVELARRSVRAAPPGAGGADVVGLCNEAAALARLGRCDEATERYERALRLGQRTGSRRIAAPLVGLGELHRRGRRYQQAVGAYAEAVRIARAGGTHQDLVSGLAGLARALVDTADRDAPDTLDTLDTLDTAARHADEAVRAAPSWTAGPALVARGWVGLAAGDHAAAASYATRAARAARDRRERAALAEALELWAAAVADRDPAGARSALVEAYGIWRAGRATADADRILVTIGQLTTADAGDRLAATLAAQRLPVATVVPVISGVALRTFGRFDVEVDGRPTPVGAWQSRKARDLLRILVTRRGRAAPREELAELLWPADDPTRTGHRLSVQLSIVRGVLDPHRRRPTDHYLVADQASVALNGSRLRVDVEDFLDAVTHGLGLRARGASEDARMALAAAEPLYTGDLFADEPYADWAVPLREEARAAYLRCVRALAELSRAAGDTEQAVVFLLRLLDKDPYDEAAHRAMVGTLTAAGRHGEARRAAERHRAAVRELGLLSRA